MKQTVNLYEFRRAFGDIRPNNFTYEGLEILFDYLEETDPDMELDVIALCCDYSESNIDDLIQDYDIDLEGVDPDEVDEAVLDFINNNSVVLGVCFDGSLVYQNF